MVCRDFHICVFSDLGHIKRGINRPKFRIYKSDDKNILAEENQWHYNITIFCYTKFILHTYYSSEKYDLEYILMLHIFTQLVCVPI